MFPKLEKLVIDGPWVEWEASRSKGFVRRHDGAFRGGSGNYFRHLWIIDISHSGSNWGNRADDHWWLSARLGLARLWDTARWLQVRLRTLCWGLRYIYIYIYIDIYIYAGFGLLLAMWPVLCMCSWWWTFKLLLLSISSSSGLDIQRGGVPWTFCCAHSLDVGLTT